MENLLIEYLGGKWERVGLNKQVGWGKKSKNANRVGSFIWHLRVPRLVNSQRDLWTSPYLKSNLHIQYSKGVKISFSIDLESTTVKNSMIKNSNIQLHIRRRQRLDAG